MPKHHSRLSALILTVAFFLFLASAALAEESTTTAQENVTADTKAPVTVTCTGCHSSNLWQGKRKTSSQWSSVVEQMIKNGADISPGEKTEIVNFLVAQVTPTTTTTTLAPQASPTTTIAPATNSTPSQQAYTGAEVWIYLLTGSSMIGTGLVMKRRR